MMAARDSRAAEMAALGAARWRVSMALTAAMVAVYFGFILLIAFKKTWLERVVAPGLTLAVSLGVAVIVAAWTLIWLYTRWANRVYDPRIEGLRTGQSE